MCVGVCGHIVHSMSLKLIRQVEKLLLSEETDSPDLHPPKKRITSAVDVHFKFLKQ